MLLSCKNGIYSVVIYNFLSAFKAVSGFDVMWDFCLGIKSHSQEEAKVFTVCLFGSPSCLLSSASSWFKVCMG